MVVKCVNNNDYPALEKEPLVDYTMGTAEEVLGEIATIYVMYGSDGDSLRPTYVNYNMYYARADENGVVTPDSRIAYIGDMSEPIMLSAPSTAFQSVSDFVRASSGNSELMNSTTLLEKIKTINGINGDILTTKYVPNEESVSLLNGVHGSSFYNGEATKVNYAFFSEDTELTSVDLPEVVETGAYAFQNCSSLVGVNLPKLKLATGGEFQGCTSLETIDLPNLIEVTAYGLFYGCTALKNVNLPNLVQLSPSGSGFKDCTSLEQIVLPKCRSTGNSAFENCTNLKVIDFHTALNSLGNSNLGITPALEAFILRDTVMTPKYSNSVAPFSGSPIGNGTGYIYVPRELVDTYKADSKWSPYANQFRALEDYTVDGTIMGEMDWNKLGITFTNEG